MVVSSNEREKYHRGRKNERGHNFAYKAMFFMICRDCIAQSRLSQNARSQNKERRLWAQDLCVEFLLVINKLFSSLIQATGKRYMCTVRKEKYRIEVSSPNLNAVSNFVKIAL